MIGCGFSQQRRRPARRREVASLHAQRSGVELIRDDTSSFAPPGFALI
jgi:hypothetical protein